MKRRSIFDKHSVNENQRKYPSQSNPDSCASTPSVLQAIASSGSQRSARGHQRRMRQSLKPDRLRMIRALDVLRKEIHFDDPHVHSPLKT